MTTTDFLIWLGRMKFNWQDAADSLGVTTRTARRYADGTRAIPSTVVKLCECLERQKKRR